MADFNLTSTMNLYNTVRGNKTEFIKQFQAEYKNVDGGDAEKWFNYMQSMDTDGTVGLTPEEHKQGLTEKKDLVEIKRDNLYGQYIKEGDEERFAAMSQEEKLKYLEGRIPHEPGYEAEVHIQASMVLSQMNRLDTEFGLLKDALSEYGVAEKSPEAKEVDKAVNDYMRQYIAEEDLPKFNKMSVDEQIEYLKTHIAHEPGVTDEQLREEAVNILLKRDHIREVVKTRYEALNSIKKSKVDQHLLEYVKESDLEAFKKMSVNEQLDYLKSTLPSKPDETEIEKSARAYGVLAKLQFITNKQAERELLEKTERSYFE